MKLYICSLLVACCLLASGCSKSSEDEPEIIVSEEDNFFTTKVEGVKEWKEENFRFNRYYTLIDTTGIINLSPSVLVKYFNGSSVSVNWSLNNSPIPNNQESNLWNSSLDMWFLADVPETTTIYNFGDKLQAIVNIGTTQIMRSAVISESKTINDIFAVNFGMNTESVQNAELARIEKLTSYVTSNTWREYQPNTAVIWFSSNIQGGITIYRFNEGKLNQVGEYTTTLSLTSNILSLCTKYGLRETPELTSDGILAKDYIWNNGKVEFRLSIIDDAPVFGSSTSELCKALGISYRKL